MSHTCLVEDTPGNIGRVALVNHKGFVYRVTVLDQVYGTTIPKRVRAQNRDLQGQVLQPREYEFLEWEDDAD
jgi:hypothetical protein